MIRWGILGAGHIAGRFVKGLSFSDRSVLYAVASRSGKKREQYADYVTYSSYEQLLDDPNVDVVYLAMWHKDHFQWAMEALKKKKAVLCEKPAVLSTEQMEQIAQCARENDTFFMEAMKTRFLPMIIRLKALLDEGTIGTITRVENRFCYDIGDAQDTRYLFEPEQGGILNDVGSYNMASLLDYIGDEIVSVENDVVYKNGVDVHDRVTVTFANGQTGFLEMAMDEAKEPLMTITGTKGSIECAPFYRPEKIVVKRKGEEAYAIECPYEHDDFYSQIKEVEECLLAGKIESDRMSLQDSIEVQRLADRIREIIRRGNKDEVQ